MDNFRQIVRIFAPIYRNIPSYPNHELLVIVLMQRGLGGNPKTALHQERKFWFIRYFLATKIYKVDFSPLMQAALAARGYLPRPR